MRRETMRVAFKAVVIYFALSAIFALLLLVFTYPDFPTAPAAWSGAFLLALFVQPVFEWLWARIGKTTLMEMIDERAAGQHLPLLRIAFGVVVFLATLGLLFAAGWLLKSLLG